MDEKNQSALNELSDVVKRFEYDNDVDRLAEGITSVADNMGTVPWDVYLKVAHYLNQKKYGKEGYICEEAKSGKGDCIGCAHILSGTDACSENSSISPVYRAIHPEHVPPHFEKRKEMERAIIFELPYIETMTKFFKS